MDENKNGAAVKAAHPKELKHSKDNNIPLLAAIKSDLANGNNSIPDSVFIPTWSNKPDPVPAILTLGGISVLTHQNTSSIIASPGTGKSSIGEAVCAAHLNPNADCLGFEVDASSKGALFIDGERTTADVWNSFQRMCRRAGIPEGKPIERVKIAGLRSISRVDERKKIVEALLQEYEYSLLILDGAGDFVNDTNDITEATELRIWLRDLTVKYKVSILLTLHPNPNSNKPRGHTGSEAWRESECVMLAKLAEGDIRVITTEFEHGKNRNNPPVTTAFRWSDIDGMFMSVDTSDLLSVGQSKVTAAKRNKAELTAYKYLPQETALYHSELL